MREKIIIIGAGETADIAYQYISADNRYEVVAFAVNEQCKTTDSCNNKPLLTLEALGQEYSIKDVKAFVAMSSGKLNTNRECVYKQVKEMGFECISYISPRAFVAESAVIGENCFIFEDNVIQHGVQIGSNVILWSGNHIGHQTKIRDHVFVSSHCVISGFCEIGENSFLGVNCTFSDHIKIGRDCFVGMGAIVAKDLGCNTLIKPAKSQVARISAKTLCRVD